MLSKEHQPVLKLIDLISENVEYLELALQFWELVERNHRGEGKTSHIQQIFSSILKALLTFPISDIEFLAQSFLERYAYILYDVEEKRLPDFIPFTYFVKTLTLFAYYTVENLDIRSAQGFLSWAFNRIVKTIIYNTKSKTSAVLEQSIEVIFYSQENVEFVLKQEQRFKKGFHPFYFEELVKVDTNQLKKASQDPDCIIKMEFNDNIIPTGLSAESILVVLQNNALRPQENYEHLNSTQFPLAKNVKLTAIIPASLPVSMTVAVNQQTMGSYPILSAALLVNGKQVLGREFQFYRLNPYFIRQLSWATHSIDRKTHSYNSKSEFFSEDDFGVDQVNKLNKRWDRKAVQANKSLLTSQLQGQDLTQSVKNSEKRIPKDYPSLVRSFYGDLQNNINNSQDQDRLLEAIEFLDITNNNKLQQIQTPVGEANHIPSFSSYISKFASQYNRLPVDSSNPYEDDVIEYANRPPLQILLLAKPKSGRSTFAKALAKRLDIEYIDLQRPINRIFDKIKENEENPQMDEEGNPKEFLTVLERRFVNNLKDGVEIPSEDSLELLNLEFTAYEAPTNKGFILDLPIEQTQPINWVSLINQNKLKIPRIQCRHFTHVIHLKQSDQAVLQFAKGLMEKQEDLSLSSQAYRDVLRRPKVKKQQEEDEEEAVQEEEEEAIKPLNEGELFYRPSEDEELLKSQLQAWHAQSVKIKSFYEHMLEKLVLQIEAAGLTSDQLVSIVAARLPKVKAPLAIKLEGGSEKELLSLNLEEQKIQRQWSQWQLIDPVELLIKEKVVQGKVEFACDYAGRVFLFDNEINQQKFLQNPRKYLQKAPELPKSYNVAIVGPRKSGKKTIAKLLAEKYGWKLVDVEDILRQKIINQRSHELEKHVPSTYDPRIRDIHLTELEWRDFYKGGPISTKDVLPMVLNHLGLPLQKKPQGWGEPKKEEQEEDNQEEQEKLKREAAKKNLKKKKEEEKKEEHPDVDAPRPATPPPEDVPTKEIIPQLDAELKVAETSKPKGIILVGYPHNQEQIDLMNLFGIKLDKIISLQDKSEEPGQVLLNRPGFSELYQVEQEMTYHAGVATILKEAYGEDNIKEVGIEGSVNDVWIRIQTQLDPTYIRVDDEALVRTQADVQEGDDPLQFGNYGTYCPVTLKNSGWLVPGKDDFISQVRGRVYKFYAEKEQAYFKENVFKFMSEVQSPPPRVMFMGVRGSGLRTQLQILNQLYKIPLLFLKDNLLKNLRVHKQNRQQDRYFLRGFKIPEFDEEGKEIADPEVMEDPADFDRRLHEVEQVNNILKDVGAVFIEGNFFDVPEDLLQTSVVELLQEARKLPEMLVLLKIDLKTYLERNFDQNVVKQEYNTRLSELKARRQQERLDARKKAIDDGVPEEEWPPVDVPEGTDEEDPEAPKLEEMLNENREKHIQKHEADSAKIDEIFTQFNEELKVPAVIVTTDTTLQNVTDRIQTVLYPYLDRVERENIFEKFQTYKLNPYPDPENFKINRLQVYEESYNYRPSRYGDRNPITLLDVPHVRDYPLLYRNRIYYLSSEEEREQVAKLPLKFLQQPTVPTDVLIKPALFVIGKPKSGKSTIAKMLSEKLQLVRLKVSYLIETYIQYQIDPLALKVKDTILRGQVVDDHSIIQLLQRRVQEEDCYKHGWVLDGFPQNREQAVSLSKAGLIPTAVFAMETDIETIKQRSLKDPSKFGSIDHILQVRLNRANKQYPLLTNYYQTFFNNVRYLSTLISNWGLLHICVNFINDLLKRRADLARALITQDPVNVSALTLTEAQIHEKLSPMLTYCPIALKQRQFLPQPIRQKNLLFYDDQLYICGNDKAEQDFIENPTNYVSNDINKYNVPVSIPLAKLERGAILEYQGKCPVALLRDKLENGLSHLLTVYKKKCYAFSDVYSLKVFETNPKLFKRAHLPDKLPIVFEKNKNIAKKVAKRGDCTSYLGVHLSNIIIRVLAQLGYKRMKYPTLSCKETVLKFIAISLKANNPNKDHLYRAKYQKKLNEFLRHCEYPQQIQQQAQLKKTSQESGQWQPWDQENLLKMTEQFDSFMNELESQDKQKYFYKFIR